MHDASPWRRSPTNPNCDWPIDLRDRKDWNRGWFESYYQHGDSAVDKFNNGNGTTIGAVEGSSYRGEMKDETKTEIQNIMQKIISLEFKRPEKAE